MPSEFVNRMVVNRGATTQLGFRSAISASAPEKVGSVAFVNLDVSQQFDYQSNNAAIQVTILLNGH